MVLYHCSEILFNPSPAIISVDDVTNDFQIRIGASFNTSNEAVNITCSLYAVVLCLKRDICITYNSYNALQRILI
jgi:hypothetical protein